MTRTLTSFWAKKSIAVAQGITLVPHCVAQVVQSLVWVYAELEWQQFCELMNIFLQSTLARHWPGFMMLMV
jgi:hypothetical protein